MDAPLVFSAELAGHTADVRALASHRTDDGTLLILSGSRDQTARLWVQAEDRSFRSYVIDNGNGFVNAVAFFVDVDGKLYALTGGQDALVNAYLVSFSSTGDVKVSSTPRFSLVGHADNVCTLGVFESEYIVSGSWDATVRVWKNWECVATLVGPSLAVWSVLPLDSQHLLAASADKSVSLWSLDAPSAPVASFTGATQAVRGLAQLSPTSFASCGNDGAIRVYPLGTDAKAVAPQATLHGHASFVYSLAALGETLVSSGEDRTVCVWKNGALQQMLTLPAISVWCVCALPGGDIACGTSDGQVRLFSAARPASDELVAAYEATVATQALADAEVDASTPRGERTLLDAPGSAEGATVVVRDGSVAEVHRWSQHASSWKKVGVVTDAAASQQKKMLDGKAYDYVFDVDVEDGAPPLKLGYNASENPYDAANRFLGKYQLPATYLDQVVQFLEKNTQAVGLSAPTASDPYTGSSSYTPQPTQAAPAPPLDPFTGAGGITSSSRTLRVLPQEQYLAFLQTNLDAARAKIRELAGGDAPLSDEDAARLDRLVDALRAKTSADVSVLSALLSQWPPAKRFPLLDLLRIAAAQPSTAPFSALATEALIGAEWDALDHYQGERKHAETNAMLALRVLANGFVAPGGPQALNDMALEALATLQQPPWAMLNKNARIALATIALNYSVLAVRSSFAHTELLLSFITELLRNEGESEMVYRALVALGNVLASPSGSALPAAPKSQALQLAETWASRLSEDRVAALSADLEQLRP